MRVHLVLLMLAAPGRIEAQEGTEQVEQKTVSTDVPAGSERARKSA